MKGLLQIHDPLKPKGYAVGIDLGTTNSLVANVENGKPGCLSADENGEKLLPSVVHYATDGAVVVGRRALELLPKHPTDTIKSVKRFMGKSYDDAETKKLGAYRFHGQRGVVRFEVSGGQPVTPIEVSGEILRALKRRAEAHFSAKVEQAVITVPAYFDDAQRQATRDAGRLAGLDVLRLLNEPTAAALAYGLDKGSQGLFAVYDLGGGTFDISILELTDGVFQVKSTGGDSALGGDDFDRAIAESILGPDPSPETGDGGPEARVRGNASAIASLLLEARAARERLTTTDSTPLPFDGKTITLTRNELDALIAPLLERTGVACRRALKDAGIKPAELDGVVLVGGTTRMPAVRAYVEKIFGKEPLGDIDPDQVVALGAAVQADLLTNADRQDEVLLLDVIPLSLGLETMGGVVEKLIARNSTIPVGAAQVFTTGQDGQSAMDIHVLQGERELVEDCRSLARFKLSGIPAMPAGVGRVEVRFKVDADGILAVSAKEQTTGVEQQITVKPSHGLTDEEIEQMLLDSIDHAEDDMQKRQLREQQVAANELLLNARKQIIENGDLLEHDERSAFERSLTELERLTESATDYLALKAAITELDDRSKPFVERIMNRAISKAVAGHRVEEY